MIEAIGPCRHNALHSDGDDKIKPGHCDIEDEHNIEA